MRASRRTVAMLTLVLALVWSTRPALGDVTTQTDITYAKVGDRELQVDMCSPEGDGPFPAIVFIHGGGWRGGARQGYRGAIVAAARRGYVAVTVTYRLTDPDKEGKATNPFPACVYDVKAAVRWLRAHAKDYHVDPDRIGATGGSAGGHLVLMLGTTDKSAGLEGDEGYPDQSSRVQAVVNEFGPTDMAELYRTSKGAAPIVASFLAGTPDDAAETYRKASPVTYVSKDDPPTLTIHGGADPLVPPAQAKLFDAAMKKAGATSELLILEGQGHGFRGEANQKAHEAMFAFFDKYLKGKGN
jgi:acetyl esterase/lipase